MTIQSIKSKVVPISKALPPIELHCGHKDRNVIVSPADSDRFTFTVEETIRACQLNKKVSEFKPVFNNLLENLGKWIKNHTDKIDNAYITVRDACLLFVVVQKDKPHDRKFEDELTDLDLSVAHDAIFSDIRLNVIAIPKTSPDAVLTFLTPGLTLKYSNVN